MVEDISWRLYERIIANLLADETPYDYSVTPNARILGCISGTKRQVDVLIDCRWGDSTERRMIVNAKKVAGKADINDIESLIGAMVDCRASYGAIVSAYGFTKGALKRAKREVFVRTFTPEEANRYSWARFGSCRGKCTTRPKGKSRGVVLWDGQQALFVGSVWSLFWTGKCDVCHEFHVWCWGCGEEFALPTEGEKTCFCGYTWCSLIEADTDAEGSSKTIHLILTLPDNIIPLDRIPIR